MAENQNAKPKTNTNNTDTRLSTYSCTGYIQAWLGELHSSPPNQNQITNSISISIKCYTKTMWRKEVMFVQELPL